MKKGFTLIELLGVIAILGIIGLIVVPIVQGTIKDSSEKICEYQEKIYKKAAKNYVASNPYQVPSEITLKQLIDAGYLEESQIKCGSIEDIIKIKPNYVNNDETTNTNSYSYEYVPVQKEGDEPEESQTNNTVYAINTNTIIKNESTLQDIGTTYKTCTETGKNVCLKYTIADANNADEKFIIDQSVCLIHENKEYCFKGEANNIDVFNDNVSLLQKIFGENVQTGYLEKHYADVDTDNISISVNEDGSVGIQLINEPWGCGIDFGEKSQCGKYGGYMLR